MDHIKLGMEAHTSNPDHSGDRLGGQHRQKVIKTPSQSINWVWWYMPVIPVMQEAL
jgi:hypothetical protein